MPKRQNANQAISAPASTARPPIDVYYVAGQPRSGSTFVGDWVARHLNTVNAGEVWQTLRAMDRVQEENFTARTERWADPEQKARKRTEIEAIPFWADVLSRSIADPYEALVSVAAERGGAIVDTSKTDRGIARYEALGCNVVVIHTARAFSTWSRSVIKYRSQYNISVPSKLRLLRGYIKLNRRYSAYSRTHSYHAIPQERLNHIETLVSFPPEKIQPDGGYLRCEAFGTRNFTGTYDVERAASKTTFTDRLLYAFVGIETDAKLTKPVPL